MKKPRAVFTLADLQKSAIAGLNPGIFTSSDPVAKTGGARVKGAIPTEVNGITFDSRKEAKRYKELLLLLKAGEIGLLELQVPYQLNEGGTHSLKYIADFVYVRKDGTKVVEDCKGFRTREYIKKRKLMLKIHNIKIYET